MWRLRESGRPRALFVSGERHSVIGPHAAAAENVDGSLTAPLPLTAALP